MFLHAVGTDTYRWLTQNTGTVSLSTSHPPAKITRRYKKKVQFKTALCKQFALFVLHCVFFWDCLLMWGHTSVGTMGQKISCQKTLWSWDENSRRLYFSFHFYSFILLCFFVVMFHLYYSLGIAAKTKYEIIKIIKIWTFSKSF